MDAEDAELSEEALEQQLQDHLTDHKASLSALDDALACDPLNEELLEVHQELSAALKSAEESLLQLKRNRLLREIDDALNARNNQKKISKGTEVLNVEITENRNIGEDCDVSPHGPSEINSSFVVGSKCRFRYSDGRWYHGKIVDFENEGFVRVSFLAPTTEKMQICKFFAEHRCRFGDNCRMSHGYVVSLDALKPYNISVMKALCIGSNVLACSSPNGEGLWRHAELESWDEALHRGKAVFVDDGSTVEVGMDNLCLREYGEASDLESTSSEEEEEVEEDDKEDSYLGLGNNMMVEIDTQMDTRVFANWEKHTRGMASRMMINMGYREGMGLGKSGQGIVIPIQTRVLPKGQSLDFIGKGEESHVEGKKKSRGGKRKRDRKLAEAARVAKAEEEKAPDVFCFINNQLSIQKDKQESSDMRINGRNKGSGNRQVLGKMHKDDRRSLMVQADEIAELKNKVEKLEEMALRNRKDKAVHEAVLRKLEEARRDLQSAEADHASASFAVQSKEKEKKWLKF